MTILKHLFVASVLGIPLVAPSGVFGGYSPQTHFSSDVPHHTADQDEDDDKPWYHHNHLAHDHYEDLEASDPTYELEDDTMYPGQREDYSDLLLR